MKISKLLNKKFLLILIIFLPFELSLFAEDEPIDIWKIEKSKSDVISSDNNLIKPEDAQKKIEPSIYDLQSKNIKDEIQLDQTLTSKETQIIGLYDPAANGLDINMWSNSNGDQIKNIFRNLYKMNLSNDAKELLNISLLTNAYYPDQNITRQEFLEIKSDWLIKNSNLQLIEQYLLENQIVDKNIKLTRYLVDQYLSNSDVDKACEIFSKNTKLIEDKYLSMFNIYCLISDNKFDEAQLKYDLRKELGFVDKYFEDKINYLFGYTKDINKEISERSILDFHLAHVTNSQFSFEPKKNTSKLIWKYLSTSNLLFNIDEIEITDIDKISTIEKATHDKNYSERELFELYKKFQFNINQLLNIKDSYKLLSAMEGRALIYQGILITSNLEKKLELIKILKESFIEAEVGNAFDEELRLFLSKVDLKDVPSNFTNFYLLNTQSEDNLIKNIKFNNKVLHQSKLVNYFGDDYNKKDFQKSINNFLKKIKRDKKYFVSKKDIIFIEALKSDGIKISNKFEDLYAINESEMPSDIQVMINNEDIGGSLLRIVEVIGQDEIDDIDDDTMYFIINTLNQLNTDPIRNKLLLKVLPLKV